MIYIFIFIHICFNKVTNVVIFSVSQVKYNSIDFYRDKGHYRFEQFALNIQKVMWYLPAAIQPAAPLPNTHTNKHRDYTS